MPAVELQVLDKRYYRRIKGIRAFCERVADMAWESQEPAEISVVLADDDFVHNLNKQYRGKDCPTNVLSFENAEQPPKGQPWLAGDIIVAYDTVMREAKAQAKTFEAHFTHLLVHGVLHLQGYDHLTEAEAKKMESLETKLMKKMGYDNPYKDVV